MAEIGITGAAGYIGSRIVKRLMEEGHDLVTLDNFYAPKVETVGRLEVEEGDVTEPDDLERFEESDLLIHLAAVSGVDDCEENPDTAFQWNVQGTLNVAWRCREWGTPMIFPASMSIIGDPTEFPITRDHPRDPLNLYGLTKYLGERNLETISDDSFPAYLFMKSNVYGSHEVDGETIGKPTVINFFVDRALSGKPLTVYEPGSQARDFIHVKDVAEAYVHAVDEILDSLEDGLNEFEIASGRSTSILEVAEKVADTFEEEEGERPEVELVDNPRSAETLVDDFAVDAGKAREELGWETGIGLEEGIRETIEEQRK